MAIGVSSVTNPTAQPAPRSISRLFYQNMNLHQAVEAGPFVAELRENPSKEAYVAYLYRLKVGLEIIEPALAGLPGLNLTPFFRLDALNADLAELGGGDAPQNTPHMEEHKRRFTELSHSQPYLLIAHAALRYYALLHGGQQRSDRLSAQWGAALSLYSFEHDAKTMINRLNDALNVYAERLNDRQIEELKKEIRWAWVFSGDIVLTDIRPLVPDLV